MVERNARRQGLLNSLSGLLSGWKVIALALVLCSLYFYCRVGEAQDGAHSDRTTATVYEGSHDRAAQVKAQGSRGLLRAPVSIAAAPEYVDPLYGDSGGRAPQVVEELPLSEVPPDGAEGPLVFHFCATESSECWCRGTLRWGAGDTWVLKHAATAEEVMHVMCSTQVFQDVLPGKVKSCECTQPVVKPMGEPSADGAAGGQFQILPASDPATLGASFWMFCAGQWQECSCPGRVRWGNDGNWLELGPKEGESEVVVKCCIEELVDIAPGDVGKHCDCLVDPAADIYETVNPGLLVEAGRPAPEGAQVTSCEIFERGASLGAAGREQWRAVEPFCSMDLPLDRAGPRALNLSTMQALMRSWVEPRFRPNCDRIFNASGWARRAFLNYYAGSPSGNHANMTEQLIRSVHEFSSEPIVVMHFGFRTPSYWTPELFPRLVLLNAMPMPTSAERSFNFNKLRAMLLSRVEVGIQLDSDMFVAPGVDRLFERTAAEITREYPMPILPAHFLDWGPSGQGPGGFGAALWHRYCPAMKEGQCRWQTQRWGHAHPTWTFWAVPFLGRWLRRNFRDETLPPSEGKRSLRIVDVGEDEDLLNVGTWEEGGTKQWCKFDLPDPSEFSALLQKQPSDPETGGAICQNGRCDDIEADKRYFPHGVAKVFYTAHHAVEPAKSAVYLALLRAAQEGRQLPPPILYHNRFYQDGEDLKRHNPLLTCLI